jgi:hypothetical protein
MQLARLWQQHLEAGCPPELSGVEIAGRDARSLDEEISACVSACITRSLAVDERIERRLNDVRTALGRKQAESDAPVAEYCARLNELVGAVLTRYDAGSG